MSQKEEENPPYRLGEIISQSTYEKVQYAFDLKNNTQVVLKIVDLNLLSKEGQNDQFRRFIQSKNLKYNPNIDQIINFFEYRNQAYLVYQLCHCSLYDLLAPYLVQKLVNEEIASHIFWQLQNVVSTLYDEGFHNYSVQFDNIFVRCSNDRLWQKYQEQIKQIKQGLLDQKLLHSLLKNSRIIITYYGLKSCQMFYKPDVNMPGSDSALVYRLGQIFYYLLFQETYEGSCGSQQRISMSTKKLLDGMLNNDPEKRLHFQEIFKLRQKPQNSSIRLISKSSSSTIKEEPKKPSIIEDQKDMDIVPSFMAQSQTQQTQSTINSLYSQDQININQDSTNPRFEVQPNIMTIYISNQNVDSAEHIENTEQAPTIAEKIYSEARREEEWQRLKRESPHLHEYCRQFTWTLQNFLDSYSIASTGVLQKNVNHTQDHSQSRKISFAKGLISISEQFIQNIPIASQIMGGISSMIDTIYSRIQGQRYEDRINAINFIVEHNKDEELDIKSKFQICIGITASSIAQRKKKEILERVACDKPRSVQAGYANQILNFFNQSMKKIGEQYAVWNVNEKKGLGNAGQLALEDVSLLIIYLQQNHKEIVEETIQGKRMYHIISDAVCQGRIDEIFKQGDFEVESQFQESGSIGSDEDENNETDKLQDQTGNADFESQLIGCRMF